MRRLGALCYLLAAASALAAVASVVVGPEWIEHVSGWSPDGGSGALESASVVLPLVAAAALALAGRRLWNRSAAGVAAR